MEIQSICESAVKECGGALGCLVVDLSTGLVVASAHRPGMIPDDPGLAGILRLAGDLFRGPLLEQFVQMLPMEGSSATGFVREAQISTSHSYQFMGSLPNWQDGLVLLITERTTNLGIGWMAVHRAQQQFENSSDSTIQAAVALALKGRPAPPKAVERPAPLRASKPVERAPKPVEQAPPAAKPRPDPQPQTAAPASAGATSASQAPLDPAPGDLMPRSAPPEAHEQPEVSEPLGPRGRMFKPRKSGR